MDYSNEFEAFIQTFKNVFLENDLSQYDIAFYKSNLENVFYILKRILNKLDKSKFGQLLKKQIQDMKAWSHLFIYAMYNLDLILRPDQKNDYITGLNNFVKMEFNNTDLNSMILNKIQASEPFQVIGLNVEKGFGLHKLPIPMNSDNDPKILDNPNFDNLWTLKEKGFDPKVRIGINLLLDRNINDLTSGFDLHELPETHYRIKESSWTKAELLILEPLLQLSEMISEHERF